MHFSYAFRMFSGFSSVYWLPKHEFRIWLAGVCAEQQALRSFFKCRLLHGRNELERGRFKWKLCSIVAVLHLIYYDNSLLRYDR